MAERVDSVLHEREARGLRVPVIARTALALLILPAVASGATRELPETVPILATTALVWIGLNAYFYRLLKRKRHVAIVGVIGALLDVTFMASQFAIGAMLLPTFGLQAATVFKSQLPMFGLTLIAINGLALRPRYPLIVGAGSFIAMLIVLGVVSRDPGFSLSDTPVEYLSGPAVGRTELFNVLVLFPIAAGAISFITHVARKTIRQTIEQGLANAELQREQLEVVMRTKVESLAKLVAGVSHELNSPLAVIKSGLATQSKALNRLEAKVSEGDVKLLDAARGIAVTVAEAVDRIDGTADSLRSFVRLDEAEFQRIDLREEVELLLERLPIPDDKSIELKRTFDEIPEVVANAKELSQALATILENAFDSIDEEGTVEVRIESSDSEITVAVIDTGRGIGPDEIETLFDVGLRPGDKRVAASFGLATAQSVAHRHDGRITVESEVGKGTTFTFHLPVAEAEETS
jgi:signal transduction histidine kinase